MEMINTPDSSSSQMNHKCSRSLLSQTLDKDYEVKKTSESMEKPMDTALGLEIETVASGLKRKRDLNSQTLQQESSYSSEIEPLRVCYTSYSNLELCQSTSFENLDYHYPENHRDNYMHKGVDDLRHSDDGKDYSSSPASAAPTMMSDTSSYFNGYRLENDDQLVEKKRIESFFFPQSTDDYSSQEQHLPGGGNNGAYGWFLVMDEEELDYRSQTNDVIFDFEDGISIDNCTVNVDYSKLADSIEMIIPDHRKASSASSHDGPGIHDSYFSVVGLLSWLS